MTFLAVWNEGRPGTKIRDPVLELFPYWKWLDHWNYHLWLASWLPFQLALLLRDRLRFCRVMLAGGTLSLLRGIGVVATGLGPVEGPDINVAHDWTWRMRFEVTLRILDFPAVFSEHTAHIWLTKDLFFSGHAASTFLLVLALRPYPRLRCLALLCHVLVVLSLYFGKIHYTVDILGAYAVTWAVWRFWFGRGLDDRKDPPPSPARRA